MEQVIDTVGQVGDVSKNISDYGPSIVIIATFIVLFVMMCVTLLLIMKKQMNNFMNQYNALLTNMMNSKKDEKPKDFVKNFIDVQIVFKNASKILLEKMSANRVAIYVFHNGNKSAHGFPFYKMSCIGEWLKKSLNTNCRIKDHIDIPLFAFDGIVENLYNNGYFENITNIEHEKEEVESFTNQLDTEYIYIQGILDNSNNLAGFSIIEFKEFPTHSLDTIKQEMIDINKVIKGIIADSKLQEKL